MIADLLGWNGLTPNEQLAGISGGVITGGGFMALRVLFGGLRLKRREPSRRIRHRPGSRPAVPRKRRKGKGRGKSKGRR